MPVVARTATLDPRIDLSHTAGRNRVPGGLVPSLLALARDHLDMDVALVSEFTERDEVFQAMEGEGDSFGIRPGSTIPLMVIPSNSARIADRASEVEVLQAMTTCLGSWRRRKVTICRTKVVTVAADLSP